MPAWSHRVTDADVIPEPGLRFTFRVRSRSKPGEYHSVFLAENEGCAQCTCPAHAFKNMPFITKRLAAYHKSGRLEDHPVFDKEGRADCWHVRQVMEYLEPRFRLKIAAHEQDPTQPSVATRKMK